MAINTIDNFSYKGAKPLDARLVFNTLDEMTSYPKENLYVGIIMYCRETSKHYTYNGISIDEMSMGSGTGGSIDESKFALKSELDEFDPNAHKQELQTIANEVTNKMSIFNELTEIDIDKLKAQIKVEILAELRTVASADGAGA